MLLITFAFNLGGYYLLFKALQVTAHDQLIQRLDNEDYTEDQLVELKIPMSLPYSNYLVSDYKRINGRLEHDGEIYKLVKQKLEGDTLYLMAIKDTEEKSLISKFKDFTTKTHDIPLSQKKQSSQTLKQLQKEYNTLEYLLTIDRLGIWTKYCPADYDSFLVSPLLEVSTPPPQA